MVACILARISRGCLFFRVLGTRFLTFASAVRAEHLGMVELIGGETAAPELTLVGGCVA